MGSYNLYLNYKRDRSRLVYWIINTSNGIIQSATNAEDCASVKINTTGQIEVSELPNMARLIAKTLESVPYTILRLFETVIEAQKIVYLAFRDIADEEPDPKNEKTKLLIDESSTP